MMAPSHPQVKRPVVFAGANPLILLYRPGGNDLVAVASLWQCAYAEPGPGHSLVLWGATAARSDQRINRHR